MDEWKIKEWNKMKIFCRITILQYYRDNLLTNPTSIAYTPVYGILGNNIWMNEKHIKTFNTIHQIKNFKITWTALNKNDQRDAAWNICLYYSRNSTLHVLGALCTHHQGCIEIVHADATMNSMFTTTLTTTAPLGTTEMTTACNRDTSKHTPKVIVITILFGKF